ncbi:MAG: hypothetical protein K1X89_03275 [Myxococcaceae bacterium]|nr:hypothetical protein [Myxococcaceae bacterium]
MTRTLFFLCLVPALALADDGFGPANQRLFEQSFVRACDGFTAYLKASPGAKDAREAQAKKAYACYRAGRGNGGQELRTLADTGEKDFARAYAAWALSQLGERQFSAALPLLKQAASGDDRAAKEARMLFVSGALQEMERQQWNQALVVSLADQVLEVADTPGPKAKARYLRAVARLNGGASAAQGEKELLELGQGDSEWADDALFMLGQRREQANQFVAALEKYDEVVRRFSGVTSNTRETCASRAAEIRRPFVTLSLSTFELPGLKPQASLAYRNVKHARYALYRLALEKLSASAAFRGETAYGEAIDGAPVKSFEAELAVSAEHARGSTTLDLDVPGPGAYWLTVDADGQKASAFALVTSTVTVLKASRFDATAWVVDAESGKAVPGAKVTFFVHNQDTGANNATTVAADEQGLARLELGGTSRADVVVWSRGNDSYSGARGSSGYWSRRQEYLAYVLRDRPLYKPGEVAEFKVFLRSREDGPSVPVANERLTMSVRDPSGREVARPSVTTGDFGTAAFSVPLGASPQLGTWSVSIQSSVHSFQQAPATFQVEEYKPPEYSVSVAPPAVLPPPGAALKVKVSASFFFGGPVANASGRALVRVSGWSHTWAPWPDEQTDGDVYGIRPFSRYGRGGDWDYGYPYRPQLGSFTLQFKTGADGTAEVEVPALKELQGQTGLEYSVQALLTDASRREVQGTGVIHLSQEPDFVDLRTDRFLYRPGEKVVVSLRAEDANGKPANPEVELRLLKLGAGGAVGAVLAKGGVALAQGTGTVKLDADALGPVRVEARRKGAAEGSPPLDSFDVWLTSDTRPFIPPQPGFFLFTDSAPLKAGDMLRVLVVAAGEGGHALVTLETDRVLVARSVPLQGRARYVELPLSAAMAPNAFLHVTRVENASLWQQQQAIRVRGEDHELEVAVKPAQPVVEPGVSLEVDVAVGGPKAGELEVAVTTVDEALYALAPEPKDFLSFFGRRARQQLVQTASSFNWRTYRRPLPPAQVTQKTTAATARPPVAEASKEEAVADRAPPAPPMAAPAASGAGRGMNAGPAKDAKRAKADDSLDREDGQAQPPSGQEPVKVRKNFATSAGFQAALSGRQQAPVRAKLRLTDSLTTWRTTAYVVSQGPQLGVGRGTVRTEKPLMVRLQAPRFFTERDEVTLSAIVTSRLATTAQVEVALSASGLKPLSSSTVKLSVEPGKDARVDVRFQVVEPGEVKAKAIARGGGKADAMELTLPAVVHGSAQRAFFAGRLSEKFGFDVELPEKRKAGQTRLELQLSPSLLAVMFDGLPYLAQYPYGCVEQTLSRFVPATIAAAAVKDLGLPASRVPPNLGDMTQAGLKRLVDFQHGDGGWGWWQTDSTNRWMSAYVVYGLSLGQAAGLQVPPGMLERGRSFLTGALGGALNDPETHAFMTYALAATGGAPKAALDADFEVRTRLSPRGRALVALSLLAAKDPRARIAVENLDDVVRAAKERSDASVGAANDPWSTSQAIEATAWVLLAMVKYDVNSPNVKPLTDFLVLRRNGGKWRSTRDTAFAIYALAELARVEKASARSGTFVVLVNGKEVKRLSFAKGGLDLVEPLVLADAAFKPGANHVEVRRDGGATGYFAATWDVYNQNDFIKGVGGDVKVKRSYVLLGKPSLEKGQAPTEYGMPVESGMRVRVDLEVTANKAVEFVMVEDLKPAGFEAVLLKSGPEVCSYQCAHAELRTDRVAMFLTSLNVGTTKLSYELRAEVPGKFAALPARFEAMYAPELQATADEMRFEVTDVAERGVAAQ